MLTAFLALLIAQAATPTPSPTPASTPTPPINLLLTKQTSEAQPAQTLGDVAKRIKLRMPADKPRVLTNESVRRLAAGVELTTSIAQPPIQAGASGGQSPEVAKKTFWQERYKAALVRVAQLEAEIKRLSTEAARLETSFYATDDPAQRDGVIKPAWDKTLADLRAAQVDLEEARQEPDKVLDQARRAGAEPGWFRGLDEAAAAAAATAPYLPPTPTPAQGPKEPPPA